MRLSPRIAVAVSAVALAATAVAVPSAAAGASAPARHHGPATYLALGDSVPFGYREAANLPKPDYAHARSFVGYPEDIGANLGLSVANASCPGETTASLISQYAQSNGCENSVGSPAGYRDVYPLHVAYRYSQLAYAIRYLHEHQNTRLVTLGVGANDLFVCQETTPDNCASEFPALLRKIGRNVDTILEKLRHDGGYRGTIVVVTYYSTDYSDVAFTRGIRAADAVLAASAGRYHARVADGFGAFRRAAAQAGGDSCRAGLLTILTTGGCGIHLSVAGSALLAQTVEQTVAGSH